MNTLDGTIPLVKRKTFKMEKQFPMTIVYFAVKRTPNIYWKFYSGFEKYNIGNIQLKPGLTKTDRRIHPESDGVNIILIKFPILRINFRW